MNAAKRIREPSRAELDRLVPASEACARLGICARTLRRMIDRGQVRAVKIGHGRGVWRVSETELARVIAEGTARA